MPSEDKTVYIEQDCAITKCDKLHIISWESIDYWMDYYKIHHKDIVKRQIRLESSYGGKDFSSPICIENRNLFGMRMPGQRFTTATFVNKGHAGYPDFIRSIEDYSIWQRLYYKGGDYYEFLAKSGYAGDTTYISKLKSL